MPAIRVTPEVLSSFASFVVVGLDRVCDGPTDRDDTLGLLCDALARAAEVCTGEVPGSVLALLTALRDELTAIDSDQGATFDPVYVGTPAGWQYVD